MKQYYIRMVACCFLFLAACNSKYADDQELELILNQARENRIELEKVLKHYSAEEDSMKYKAAVF